MKTATTGTVATTGASTRYFDNSIKNSECYVSVRYCQAHVEHTRREFYGKNFQSRILNREQVEKLTSLTKRI